MPHSRSLFNRAAVYQVTAMSFEETNLQDSDCTIPAAGGKDSPVTVMPSALLSAKDFSTSQRQLVTVQQSHSQMEQQLEYKTLVSQLELLTQADQLL